MKRLAIYISVVAALTAGCSSEDRNPGSSGEVAFSVTAANSRAAVTTMAGLKKIGVFGYSHVGLYADNGATAHPDYFLNTAVIDKDADGTDETWKYNDVVRYWPMTGINLSFFAYAPYDDLDEIFVLRPNELAGAGAPTIEYTVPADIYDQIDLIWGNSTDQTYDKNGGVVAFTMNHALTRVNFQIKLADTERGRPYVTEITSLNVANVIGEGTLDLSKSGTDSDLWATIRPDDDNGWADYVYTPAYGGGLAELVFDGRNTSEEAGMLNPFAFNNLFTTGQYLMLIPQSIGQGDDGLTPGQVVLTYSYTNVYTNEKIDDEVTLPLAQGTLTEWKPGQAVNYQITLSLDGGTKIEFDIVGFLWDLKNGDAPITGQV